MNDHLLEELLERVRTRFYGKYRGIVTDVEEGGRGRIKALVPSILGDQKTGWCAPCVPFAGKNAGLVFLPDAGSGVWIEFEGGDVSYPIWVGCYFRDNEIPAEVAPRKRVLRTAAGLSIVWDDATESIVLSDLHGNAVSLSEKGIQLSRSGGEVEVVPGKVSVNGGALEVV